MKANHTIGVVSKRTGLSPHLIRMWELRYKAVEPLRTESNRRLYSENDIERLILLSRASKAGESIGQIARLSTNELKELNKVNIESLTNDSGKPDFDIEKEISFRDEGQCLNEANKALTELDSEKLEVLLTKASKEFGHIRFIESIIIPLLKIIGDRWSDGSLRVIHEHQASVIIRTILGSIVTTIKTSPDAPILISTTPSGQFHEFGALFITILSRIDGWNSIYIGNDTPIEDIGIIANKYGARAVSLSLVYPYNDPNIGQDIIKLKSLLNEEVEIIAGGQASLSYAETINRAGAHLVHSLNDFRKLLKKLKD